MFAYANGSPLGIGKMPTKEGNAWGRIVCIAQWFLAACGE
jgi:hypothetical protein